LCKPDSKLFESGERDYAKKRKATIEKCINQTDTGEKPR